MERNLPLKHRCREKPHRLPREYYVGQRSVSFTACESRSCPLLANPQVFELAKTAVEIACRREACACPIFTLMPDHAHLLFIGGSESSDVLAAMEYFKWRTGSQFTAKKMAVRWQKDFYDDILTGPESWAAIARYIALNPIRAGLCEEPEEWPYTGSVGYTLDEVFEDAFTIA